MRLLLSVLLLSTTACVGFNQTSLKYWYPPPDEETQQLCIKERASRCTEQALAMIDASADPKNPERAAQLLGAACQSGDAKACDTLKARFVGPKRLDPIPKDIGHGLPHASNMYGEIACTINLQGEAVKCRSIMNGGYNSTYIEALLRNRYTPATFDGHPFESEYVERYTIQGDYPG